MSDRTRLLLMVTAAACWLGAVLFVLARPITERGELPRDPRLLAARLAAHPTDWRAASALTEISLDTQLPRRMELWRAAHELAASLAPTRDEPKSSFARGGFFHWTEMTPAERREMLVAFEPQLREPGTFFRMARPFFLLTGDLSMLRKSQPHTEASIELLLSLAAVYGRFADYRALRDELTMRRIADFDIRLPLLDGSAIITALPPPPYHTDLQPLLVAALNALQQRPLAENPNRPVVLEELIDYALRHDVQPLDGLEAVTRIRGSVTEAARIRLARKLGLGKRASQIELGNFPAHPPPEQTGWEGLCGDEVCGRASRTMETSSPEIELTLEPSASDDVPPYVEVYADDARLAEGEVVSRKTFLLPTGAGKHRLEIVVINPLTRNAGARRVRIITARANRAS